jgi:hypothetical protein
LNALEVNDARQAQIHTTELLVPEHRSSKLEIATEKWKRHKSSGIDQNPAKLIQGG